MKDVALTIKCCFRSFCDKLVTVNDYLAQRDAEWMGQIHCFLGLSVGLIQRGMDAAERRSNYNCDITYINNSKLEMDGEAGKKKPET
ncbi:uncharacterized protein LOC109834269 [Asparagus officinalis]|uniref:uncharacterized protein LOC109834269 n=1 Tax=Asparagus officinalis TaxID=4686 RepID=UPI00098E7B4E|nr:uncharacterized protein LOC109834269 [Asparagus officinalis]XP_020257839.1 uncharacterized protein LOC109834269 [Asparagus officinalis]